MSRVLPCAETVAGLTEADVMGGSGPQAAGSKDWLALGSVLGRGGVGSDLGWLAGIGWLGSPRALAGVGLAC